MRGSILKARETAPKTPESDSIKAPLARPKGRIIEDDLATRLLAGWRNISGTRQRPVGGLCGPCVCPQEDTTAKRLNGKPTRAFDTGTADHKLQK